MNDVGILTAGVIPQLPLGAIPAAETPSQSTAVNNAGMGADFESMFMSLLLKTMRETSSEEGLFPGDQSDSFGGLFDLYMGRHLSQSSPLGLGTILMNQLGAGGDTTNSAADAQS